MPRLELMGACEAIKLAKTLAKGLEDLNPKFFFYSDSQTVLSWLRNTKRRLRMFVANRVKKILAFSQVQDWQYVSTKDNPADIASRGCTPQELLDSDIWWEGPALLKATNGGQHGEVQQGVVEETEEFLKECWSRYVCCFRQDLRF